ncbi:isopentenyl-diphosphate Delta-isomerase [Chitinophaga lutea]|uniref:Isopentenyl-diphosphate delta-isomerase n=1 Tax=Chitinophaga lutea TaxID=2488634 RepID=A0A3N4QB52_9BACT|nr:isopentenyl-diphosphate Delta-isomerase [Chitinophaga lutea]RPE13220.1 isopentenyl-diphosphate Delta-isomerase [Chitinophaga lutea]
MLLPPVILVNEHDEPVGTMEKMEAHQKGLLHRAFSVFVVNSKGEMLLQQRALNKYHSGGLWTNTCCSHPLPGEDTSSAAHRRLMEEMGFDCPLREIFTFTYRAALDNDLTEYEFDHVLLGVYDGAVQADAAEVLSHRFQPVGDIYRQLKETPDTFTHWFHIAFPKVADYMELHKL